MKKQCPVCNNPRCEVGPGGHMGFPLHDCPRCGAYVVVGHADQSLPALLSHRRIDRSVLSHLIRKAQRHGRPLTIFDEDLAAYEHASPLPTPREQVDNLIRWIGENQTSPDEPARANIELIAATVGAQVSAPESNESAFQWLIAEIGNENLFVWDARQPAVQVLLRLRMKGWELYEQLRHRIADVRTAFMAMQFGNAELMSVLERCFKPAVKRAGFDLRALNELQPAGLIDNQIRAAIRSARFVVADLSHDNNGAYFEAGFAEGIGLPVLYTCRREKFEAEKTHFDTNHMVTIPWDLDDLDDAAKRLTATIRVTLPGEADHDAV